MQIAITGLYNSGKTTVFNAATGQRAETTPYPTTGDVKHIAVVNVPDPRLHRLSGLFKPKKTTHTTIQYTDCIGIAKGDEKQNRAVIDHIKDADAILHVIRAFEDETVPHPLGGIDPMRDLAFLESELVFRDFELIDKRLSAIEGLEKKGKKQDPEEKKVLLRCRETLEKETAMRDIELNSDELRAIRHLQFVSIKPEVIVLNIKEGDLKGQWVKETQDKVRGFFKGKFPVQVICGRLEMEVSELLPDEAKAFLEAEGIEEPARIGLIRASYEALGLITFFTVVGNEVRAWTLKEGANALTAAGKVHSDMEKGFIKAEVIAFDDFIKAGDMAHAREKGILRLEGKTYEVRDGDIINFRFGG